MEGGRQSHADQIAQGPLFPDIPVRIKYEHNGCELTDLVQSQIEEKSIQEKQHVADCIISGKFADTEQKQNMINQSVDIIDSLESQSQLCREQADDVVGDLHILSCSGNDISVVQIIVLVIIAHIFHKCIDKKHGQE